MLVNYENRVVFFYVALLHSYQGIHEAFRALEALIFPDRDACILLSFSFETDQVVLLAVETIKYTKIIYGTKLNFIKKCTFDGALPIVSTSMFPSSESS